MKKYVVLLLMVLLCCVCVSARAATTSEGLVYAVYDDHVEITDYTGTMIRLTVPDTLEGLPVTHIADEAFYNVTTLYSLTLPEGLVSIGEYTFFGCKNLVAVNLPATLQELGQCAFYGCSNLRSEITLPESISYLNSGIFSDCSSLTTVNLPEALRSLGSGIFNNCTSLRSITLPDGLSRIGNNAFRGCTSLTALRFPNTITFIGSEAFKDCTGLTNPNLEEASQLTTIGEGAFWNCTSITYAALPAGITAIPQNAFSGCTALKTMVLPEKVTSIAAHAFWNCTALQHMVLPETLTSIADAAFTGCSALSHSAVPGSYADKWCIRNSIMYAGLFTYEETENGKIVTGYTGSGPNVYIPTHVIGIGSRAFTENKSITTLHIPGNVKTVGEWAFYQCDNLTHIRMADGVETLGAEAFSSCDNLVSVSIPDSVTSLNSHTFYAAYSLESISLPDSITEIPEYCFSQNNALKHVQLPSSLTSIALGAFNACALTEITLPETLTSIGEKAFMSNAALEQIALPEAVTSIGTEAFRSCTALKEITILQNVTSIGENAFERCPEDLVICGMTGSLAQSYAAEYEITFIPLDTAVIPVPQNPSWKAGSTATATWDSAEAADYYQLTVYVYDEAGTMLGTTTTGTSINEVDVQLEANNIITRQENEYTTVKLAYTVKAGVADAEGKFTYGAESEMSAMWDYTFALIKLQPPADVDLHKDGTATWGCVEGTYIYDMWIYAYVEGVEEKVASYMLEVYDGEAVPDGNVMSKDISTSLSCVYKRGIEAGKIEKGQTVSMTISISCRAASNGPYLTSASSEWSERVEYVDPSLIQLQPPADVALNKDGTATWGYVEGTYIYDMWIYAYVEGVEKNVASYMLEVYDGGAVQDGNVMSKDISTYLSRVYKRGIDAGKIEKGQTVSMTISISCRAASNGPYLTSGSSEWSERVEYVDPSLIQLQPPADVALHKDGTATWGCVEGTYIYDMWIYAYVEGVEEKVASYMLEVYDGGAVQDGNVMSKDISTYLSLVYKRGIDAGKIEKGQTVSMTISISCRAASNGPYLTSASSEWSERVEYAPVIPVEAITLSPSKPVLCIGNSYILGKTITPENGYYTTIEWSSSDPGVVTVGSDGRITGVTAGEAEVTAAIGDVNTTVAVKVYNISSNIESDNDKDHVTDSAGDIIDDIINTTDPDLGDTDIPEEDMEAIRNQVTEGLWRGDAFFIDMKWYEENFTKYKNNWGQIQKAARQLNAQFAGAYNIEVEMYHKDKDGADHKIGCIEEFENEITFAFDLPTGMNEIHSGYARKYVLVRVHRGEIEAIDADVADGKCTARSDGFSDFILLYVDEPIDPVDLSGLSTLELPSSLTEIGAEAFTGVSAEVVIIPASCTSIGSRAFADCKSLKYIVLPLDADITPANDAFEGCAAVTLYR